MDSPHPRPRFARHESALSAIRRSLTARRHNSCLFHAANSVFRTASFSVPEAKVFAGEYLVASDRGLFGLHGGKMLKLFPLETYGVAFQKGVLYLTCASAEYACVCRCELPQTLTAGMRLRFSEVFRTPIQNGAGLRQLVYYLDTLAVVHSGRNSIIFLNPESGDLMSECFPLRDRFGAAIQGEHNRLNTLSLCGEGLIFCAQNAGPDSLIGVMQGQRVVGYQIRNRGAHHAHIAGETLYYSDTFGASYCDASNECGFLMANGRPVDEEFFKIGQGFVIRGFSQQRGEMILAHSHEGPRADRAPGNAALFRLVNNSVTHAMKAPFSKAHELVGLDGRHFDEPPASETWDEVNRLIATVLGPPVYDVDLGRAIVSREALRQPHATPSNEPLADRRISFSFSASDLHPQPGL